MDRPTEHLKPVGFWSYARQDDRASRESLTKLRLLLKLELEQQFGAELELFQDVGAIPHGAEWEREIRHAISKSTFFIPIVTPRFLRSEWCGREMRLFVERQDELCARYPELAGGSLIFPILYVDVKDIEAYDPEAFAEITKRQYLDFRQLRLANYDSEPVGRTLEKLASDICVLLRRRLYRAPTPEEIADAQRSEDERRRLREEDAGKESEREQAEAERLAGEAEERAEAKRQAEKQRLEVIVLRRARRKEQLRGLFGRMHQVARSPWPWVGLAGLFALALLPGLWTEAQPGPDDGTAPPDVAPTSPAVPIDFKMDTDGTNAVYGRNYAAAARLLPGECQAGYVKACTNLGYLYDTGQGLARDPTAARINYEKGCNGGEATGCKNLGIIYREGKNYTVARAYFEKACYGGDAGGCTNLGFLYDESLGVIQNYSMAREYYEKGCNGGNAIGCQNLGTVYEGGRGVTPDLSVARSNYEKACNGGYSKGCDLMRQLDDALSGPPE